MTINMEEVDAIIIHTLKSVGCDLDEDVYSLHQFSTELIVEAVARCIHVINIEIDVPSKLPPGMSARFRVGTSLANAVKDVGYRGEIGYQTFLYSNESDIRKLFMFLVEKLPKDSTASGEEVLGASALLQRSIAEEVAKRLKSPWTPPYFKQNGICWRGKPPTWQREGCSSVNNYNSTTLHVPEGLHDLTKKIPKESRKYWNRDLPYITSQPLAKHDIAASILEANCLSYTAHQEWENEWNTSGLPSRLSPEEYKARKREKLKKKISAQLKQNLQKDEAASQAASDLASVMGAITERAAGGKTKGSRFTHTEKLQFAQDEEKTAAQMGMGEGPRVDTEEEQLKKREEEQTALKEELEALTKNLETMELNIKKYTASTQRMEKQTIDQDLENKEKEENYKVKKKTMDLLPDAENNIAKLKAVVEASSQRLVTLGSQWEKHKIPLMEQISELKKMNEGKMSETQKILEEIKVLREKMKEVASDARGKEELYKQLVTEYERMTKDVNRSAYTRKIMEIVANIKKQKTEIEKVLIDTKAIQKEINQLTGKLDRTFAVTDELIFRDARKDEAVRKAYKYLASLHDSCNSLIKTVEETGIIMREIRDLEDQIEKESHSKVLTNLEKITADYLEMKKENQALIAKVKSRKQ